MKSKVERADCQNPTDLLRRSFQGRRGLVGPRPCPPTIGPLMLTKGIFQSALQRRRVRRGWLEVDSPSRDELDSGSCRKKSDLSEHRSYTGVSQKVVPRFVVFCPCCCFYHLCLNLHEKLLQPGAHFLAQPSALYSYSMWMLLESGLSQFYERCEGGFWVGGQGCNSIDILRMALTRALTIALSGAFLNVSSTHALTCALSLASNSKCLLNCTPSVSYSAHSAQDITGR